MYGDTLTYGLVDQSFISAINASAGISGPPFHHYGCSICNVVEGSRWENTAINFFLFLTQKNWVIHSAPLLLTALFLAPF